MKCVAPPRHVADQRDLSSWPRAWTWQEKNTECGSSARRGCGGDLTYFPHVYDDTIRRGKGKSIFKYILTILCW